MARINRGKYNFSELGVGDTLKVKPIDFYSMKNSLAFYNKKHEQSVELEYNFVSDTLIIATRIK